MTDTIKSPFFFVPIAGFVFLVATNRLFLQPTIFALVRSMILVETTCSNKKYLEVILPLTAMCPSILMINCIFCGQYHSKFIWLWFRFYWASVILIAITSLLLFVLHTIKIISLFFVSLLTSNIISLLLNLRAWISSSMPVSSFQEFLTRYPVITSLFSNTILENIFCYSATDNVFRLPNNNHVRYY